VGNFQVEDATENRAILAIVSHSNIAAGTLLSLFDIRQLGMLGVVLGYTRYNEAFKAGDQAGLQDQDDVYQDSD